MLTRLSSPDRSRNGSVQCPPVADTPAQEMIVTWGDPRETKPCDLLPPDAFYGEEAPRPPAELLRSCGVDAGIPIGPKSRTVEMGLFSECAGWRTPPTAAELYHAMRAPRPTTRQALVMRTWLRAASFSELLGGWIEYAYTWRDLVQAAHRTGPHRNELKHWLNDFARPDHRSR